MEMNRIHFSVEVFHHGIQTHFSNASKKKYCVEMHQRVALCAWNEKGQEDPKCCWYITSQPWATQIHFNTAFFVNYNPRVGAGL